MIIFNFFVTNYIPLTYFSNYLHFYNKKLIVGKNTYKDITILIFINEKNKTT